MISALFALPSLSTPSSGNYEPRRVRIRSHFLGSSFPGDAPTLALPRSNASTHYCQRSQGGTLGRVGTLIGRVLKFERSKGDYRDVCKHLGIPDPGIAGEPRSLHPGG